MELDLFQRFQQRLTAAGGEAYAASSLVQAAEIIAAHPALTNGQVIVPPGFAEHPVWGALLPLLAARGIVARDADTPGGVADAPAGLSGAEMAIAETGSVLLADNALETRLVGMLTLAHFVLAERSHLVPMLDDAGNLLQRLTRTGNGQRHYISIITGPSRTADIERTLTIGVQGPRTLCALIVG
ncbi:MAG TPA: lactate utilization protein [Ktedonobacteraceae bacterium]|nr:lactate utilization protein [Ktedonobacteraceae bacterium]